MIQLSVTLPFEITLSEHSEVNPIDEIISFAEHNNNISTYGFFRNCAKQIFHETV